MVIALIVLALSVLALLIQLIRYEKELRQMAQFLKMRDRLSNVSPTINVHSRGIVQLAKAINNEIESHRTERLESQQQKRSFQASLAHLSHDIRTPLTGAKGYIQLMEDESDPKRRFTYLQAVTRRLNDLNHLLDQLFMFTQVSDPEYQLVFEQVDAIACLSETLLSFYPKFKEKGIEPVVQLESDRYMITTDREALTRIMNNLIANALCHGSGPVIIQQQGSIFSFSNSVAYPDDLDIDRIFDRFYKGDATRSGEGSGLGLAIVKQLTEATGAQVSAKLTGNTLSFIIVLPGTPI